jgi:tetraether lipid synthase
MKVLGVREATDHVYYSMTKSLCGVCKTAVDAKIIIRDNAVYFDKFCPAHGRQECLASSSAEWYLDCMTFLSTHQPPKRVMKEVEAGCPFDCGACPQHQQKVYLPVIPITSGCNLDCPICYTINKNEHAYAMTRENFQQVIDHLLEDHEELDIINFTGGEPTLHPELPDFLQMCRDAGIRRLTISTNGLKLLDESYVRKLAAFDARIVLSLDTFDPAIDKIMLGANTVTAKLNVIDLLEKHDVTTTILPAVAAGLNDKDVPKLLDLMLTRPHICSLELHTMTFTGQGGVGFNRSARITIPDLHKRLDEATGGRIAWRDFVPSPLAHPHCYSICYLLMIEGGYVPFARLMPRAKLYELLGDSLYIEPREKLDEVFRGIIDELWTNPEKVPESDAVLKSLKRLIAQMFPSDRQLPLDERRKIAERSVKAIYIHSHMDEENFDVSRIMKCCVGVPSPDGSNIPTCSYNVLYREKDPRFADAHMLERMSAAKQKGDTGGTAHHRSDIH